MGCDIHGPEIWSRHNSWTDHVATLHWTRNYLLFAIIADVRNDGLLRPVSEPKGFPPETWWSYSWDATRFGHPLAKSDDLSCGNPDCNCVRLHEHYYDADCHSASWLTIEEVAEAQRTYVRYSQDHRRSDDLAQALALMSVEKERDPDADIRLLFCFDN
jgi:hypothetical protein